MKIVLTVTILAAVALAIVAYNQIGLARTAEIFFSILWPPSIAYLDPQRKAPSELTGLF